MYWSMVGALLFLSFKQVYSWGPLHRVDSLGLLFSVSGLYLLERRWKAIWPSLLWVLAIFTRQTLLAAPLAGFILFHRFLGKKEKKAFLYWFVSPVAGLYILLAILTRGEFLRHTVLYNMNDYRWENAWPYQHQLWRNTGVFVAPALAYMIHTHLRGRHDWLPSFLLLGWLSSLLAGKVGSGENYILEFVTGVSLAVPLLCREVTAALKQENRSMTAFCPALLLIGALGNFHVSAYPELPGRLSFFNRRGYDYAWTPQPVDVGEAAIFRQWSEKNITGRVFSQFAGWTLLTRHQVEYQPFILNQLAKEKRWDYGKLTEPIRQQAFSAIVIEHGEIPDPNRVGPGTDTFPSEFFVSMFGRYTLVPHPGGFGPGNAWGNVYVPAPPPVP
jgi:energy-coupling factor transporter transmembrane protein EcfT